MSDFSDNNPFAPPKAALADPPTPGSGHLLAGRGARLGAVMLDSVIAMVIVFAAMFATGQNFFSEIVQTRTEDGSSDAVMIMVRSFLPGYVIVAAVQGWFLHSYGGTLGKKLLGLRIVRSDGSRAGFVRLFFVRAGSTIVVGLIPLLGGLISLIDSLLIFRDSRQCLHDQIADTIVIKITP